MKIPGFVSQTNTETLENKKNPYHLFWELDQLDVVEIEFNVFKFLECRRIVGEIGILMKAVV